MKHILVLFFMCLSILIATPFISYGAGLTMSFGGRVYLAPIPGITCTGTGTSAVVSSNKLPVYATDPQKVPRFYKQILGRKYLIPDFSTCKIGNYPVPVRKTTNNYNVSR